MSLAAKGGKICEVVFRNRRIQVTELKVPQQVIVIREENFACVLIRNEMHMTLLNAGAWGG